MKFKATMWTCATGGVGWTDYEDGLLLIPSFTSQASFNIMDEVIKKIDRTQLIVTAVEYDKYYALVFYEDPRDKLVPDHGFLMAGMSLQGHYNNFKENHKINSKIYFSYTEQIEKLTNMKDIPWIIKPLVKPFLIKSFRTINESELKLTEFMKQKISEDILPNNFEYYNESIGIMTVMRK